MVGNNRSVGRKAWMTCVAVIIGVVTLMVAVSMCSGPEDDSKADAVATSQPLASAIRVYPERGDLVAITAKEGHFLCGTDDGIRTKQVVLPDSGGTASYGGTLLSTQYTAEAVLVMIQGMSNFVSGWVTAADGGVVPFNLPNGARGENIPGLQLEMKDFKAYVSSIEDITLCSMG